MSSVGRLFDIRTSKNGPKRWLFVHFDLQMCFSLQRRAIVRHRNFKKWPEHGVFCAFHDFEVSLSLQRRAIFPHRNFKKWSEPVSFLTFWLWSVRLATAACNFSTSQLQKVVRTWCVLYILTSKYACRFSVVPFFDIVTPKSGPNLVCFVHFDLKMCLSLQRRAIFRHRNSEKWSEPGVFCTFWLENAFLATAACNFSFLP